MRCLSCGSARVTVGTDGARDPGRSVSSSLGIRQFPNWDSLMYRPQIMRRAKFTHPQPARRLPRSRQNPHQLRCAWFEGKVARHRSTLLGSDCLCTIRKAGRGPHRRHRLGWESRGARALRDALPLMRDARRAFSVVDDYPVVLAGLKALVEADTNFQIVGEARDGRTALQLAKQLLPEIVERSASEELIRALHAIIAWRHVPRACRRGEGRRTPGAGCRQSAGRPDCGPQRTRDRRALPRRLRAHQQRNPGAPQYQREDRRDLQGARDGEARL